MRRRTMPVAALLAVVAVPLLTGLAAPALGAVDCPGPGAYISVRDGRAVVNLTVPEGCDPLTLAAYGHEDADGDGEPDRAALAGQAALPAGEWTPAAVPLPGHGCAASAWLVSGAIADVFELPGNPFGDRALDSTVVELDGCAPPATTTTTTTTTPPTTTTLPPTTANPGTRPPPGRPGTTAATIGTPGTLPKTVARAGTTTSTTGGTTTTSSSSTTTSTTIDESLPYDDSQGGAGGSASDLPQAGPRPGPSEPVDVRPLLIGAIVAVSALIMLILLARGLRSWQQRLTAAGAD